jgi:thiamine-phosphate pyrophosphorylase
MAHNLLSALRLMLVTDDVLVAGRDLVSLAVAAERGGVTSVQLRLKRATARELATAARRLIAALRVPVLVNDRPDVAIAVGAAGVHVGPDDLPVSLVRRIAPPGFIVGASAGTPEEAAAAAGADYWGVGPWRGTTTKADAGAALGSEGFARIRQLAGPIPCVAVGGVQPDDLPEIRRAGGVGAAVVRGLLDANDIQAEAGRYLSQGWTEGRKGSGAEGTDR